MSSQWRRVDGPCAACGRPVLALEEIIAQRIVARVILDPEPCEDGDTVISETHGAPYRAAVVEDVKGRFPLYRAHFWSCPKHLIEDRRRSPAAAAG